MKKSKFLFKNQKGSCILVLLATLLLAQPSYAAIPGMKGSQHIGFTVPNIGKAVDFFVDIIGCEAFFSIGPFGPMKDDWMKKQLNVNKKAVINTAHVLKCGNGPSLEIFDYSSPDQRTKLPKNSDYGGHHIGFYVEDMTAAIKYLKSKKIKVLGSPNTFTDTGMKGLTWVYFLTPWGMQLELTSYPNGQGYERTDNRRLWDPFD